MVMLESTNQQTTHKALLFPLGVAQLKSRHPHPPEVINFPNFLSI